MARIGKTAFPLVALMLALSSGALAQPADPALVETETGMVRGAVAGDVISFKGIPYAAPPLGEWRWRAPQPAKPWPGVREATKFGPECMQPDKVAKSEDCLTLNVWRPASSSAAPLPVMVWIYGGALVHGATSLYPADALARQGVIVVSMNYRMGRLGFFAHPALSAEAPDEVHGNFGHLDQRAALQWVKRNIAAFGGDPNAVTIFGESAGGGSVLVHLTSPLSQGLFHRAILQSPGLPTPREKVIPLTEMAEAENTGVAYARAAGIRDEGAAALKALRALPAARLADISSPQQIGALSSGRLIAGFPGAIRDGKLVVEAPDTVIAAGRFAKVPVLIGANDRDLGVGLADSKDALFALFGSAAVQARRIYDPRGDQSLDELKQRVLADRTMTEPARHLADLVARAGQPVWLYRFSYVAESLRGSMKGAQHAMEIPYSFNLPATLVRDRVTPDDKAMAELASAYWVSFGLRGDPNGGGRLAWPRHDPAVDRVMNFTNSGAIVGTDPLRPRLDQWREVWGEGAPAIAAPAPTAKPAGVPVTVDNFVRAETDLYFSRTVRDGAFGKLGHRRQLAAIDKQDVVRMNRDTLYSSGVFDLDASPLTITLPDPGKRFMSMQVISEDHYTTEVVYAPGRYTLDRDKVGTRYVFVVIRTLVDPNKPDDLDTVHKLQDAIGVEQSSGGHFEVPTYDRASQDKVRGLLNQLAALRGSEMGAMFGAEAEVDPVMHLIGTAIGWGGNPRSAAIYLGVFPKPAADNQVYRLTAKDVPVDGFWSISVYNREGYFEQNQLDAYSLNNLTATPDPDGAISVQFGGCGKETPNCLPIMSGWNYTVRLYRPRQEILNGGWSFPVAQPAR
uniref:Carboxylesterase, type B n=1 Tax=Rhodopseudomonas palustris (strain BisA53) TaxID=316055 RepID=Q07SQ8_RHOP5